jgi:4-hydroxy-tetrahydrodipicolinate reductase
MKIALLGYGKMGHEIERSAIEKGHSIVVRFDNEADWTEKIQLLKTCDVAIEFSTPAIVVKNIERCFEFEIPVVVGTTGWYDDLQKVTALCMQKNGTLFYASNYSIGVNIFFNINSRLASLLQDYPLYQPAITEIHHTQKLDAPSGTAISLAKDIIGNNSRLTKYTMDAPGKGEIPVQSIREGSVTGTHTVTWKSEIDQISITHEAFNRQGFVQGEIMAADWVKDRKGVFSMKDMLNL